jgi:hypothetical protein
MPGSGLLAAALHWLLAFGPSITDQFGARWRYARAGSRDFDCRKSGGGMVRVVEGFVSL